MGKGVNTDLLMDKINRQKGVSALEGLNKWDTDKFAFPVKWILNEHA